MVTIPTASGQTQCHCFLMNHDSKAGPSKQAKRRVEKSRKKQKRNHKALESTIFSYRYLLTITRFFDRLLHLFIGASKYLPTNLLTIQGCLATVDAARLNDRSLPVRTIGHSNPIAKGGRRLFAALLLHPSRLVW